MWKRLAQILGLLLCLLGWGFMGCTLAMGQWRVAKLGGQGGSSVVVTAWYWSNLWKDCYEDSTSLVNCVDLGVLWTVKSYIQAVRGLLIIGLCLGFTGLVLTFVGMECTHIGGDPRSNDRTLVMASALHILGCVSDVAGYCIYINRVAAAFLHAKADPSKLSYEIGPTLYIGLVGSLLVFLGCLFHCASTYKSFPKRRRRMVPFDQTGEEKVLGGKKHVCGSSRDSRNISRFKMASVVIV